MKSQMRFSFTFLLVVHVAQSVAFSSNGVETLAVPGPAPAPGPATAPAPAPAAGVAALRVTFEIKNYNYYDLSKQTCPETVKTINRSPTASKGSAEESAESDKQKVKPPDATKVIDEIHEHAKDIGEHFEAGAEKPLPWMEKKGGASMLQTNACNIQRNIGASLKTKSDKCETVMDVLRAAIKEVTKEVILCTLHSHSRPPAPAPVPSLQASVPGGLHALPAAAFLQKAPAPAPAASLSPASAEPEVAIFVTFAPGKEMGPGRSMIVHITLTDTPGNGIDDVAMAKELIENAVRSSVFATEIKTALAIVTGIMPKLSKVALQAKAVEQWDVKKCEGHVKGIVHQFSHTYTREQVPMALYNECTNFITKMSFSHDYVLDRMDTMACRETTARFAKHWDFGEAKDEDFGPMCTRACEAKFGKGAPQCIVPSEAPAPAAAPGPAPGPAPSPA